MKKILLTILLCGIMVISITGCGKKNQEIDKKESEDMDKELLQCLESELDGYLATEKDDLIEIPLSEIKNTNKEKIAYFKGVYASNHPDNKYIIVFPKNGTYDFYIMKDFDKYFYENFSVYQKSYIASISIYIHNQENDVDFKDIVNKCVTRNNVKDGKIISSKTLDKLSSTNKIIVKSNQKELGIINDENKLTKILNVVSSSKQYGDNFLCDGHVFDFEMYDNNNKLIDTIYIWGDGERLIPKSVSGGCSYYSISNDTDLRKIIEEETDYVFYNILDFRDNNKQTQQLIYEDNKYNYYLNSENNNEILIKFMLSNQIMTLKNALENKYISAEKVASEYPDILIRK